MTFQSIAVGIDLSPASEMAAMQAMSAARRCGARVTLIHACAVPAPVVGLPDSMRATEARYEAVLRERLTDDRVRLEALRQRLVGQGVEVSHVVVDGFADVALCETARELPADLIVIGTHGRTGIKRFLLGSVAEKTVRHASSSVLVARGAPPVGEGGYRCIVVGTDFSPLADDALARAIELAAAGAHIHVVHAWQVPVAFVPEAASAIAELRVALDDDAKKRGMDLLQTWRDRASQVTLELEADEGAAQQALVDRAEALGADLIVVGSHGRRGVRRMVLGSVAEVVVRHAPCSVLVAR